MSFKGVENISRKKWDVNVYENRARERKLKEEEEAKKRAENAGKKKKVDRREGKYPELKPKDGTGAPQRDWLKARDSTMDWDSVLGRTTFHAKANMAQSEQNGFYCKVCDCTLKDSATYVDHINGKRHQRMLGVSMRVQRVGVDKVRDTIQMLAEKRERDQELTTLDIEEKVQAKQLEWRQKDKERREARIEAKRRKRDEDKPVGEEIDEDEMMKKMMGFSGFAAKR